MMEAEGLARRPNPFGATDEHRRQWKQESLDRAARISAANAPDRHIWEQITREKIAKLKTKYLSERNAAQSNPEPVNTHHDNHSSVATRQVECSEEEMEARTGAKPVGRTWTRCRSTWQLSMERRYGPEKMEAARRENARRRDAMPLRLGDAAGSRAGRPRNPEPLTVSSGGLEYNAQDNGPEEKSERSKSSVYERTPQWEARPRNPEPLTMAINPLDCNAQDSGTEEQSTVSMSSVRERTGRWEDHPELYAMLLREMERQRGCRAAANKEKLDELASTRNRNYPSLYSEEKMEDLGDKLATVMNQWRATHWLHGQILESGTTDGWNQQELQVFMGIEEALRLPLPPQDHMAHAIGEAIEEAYLKTQIPEDSQHDCDDDEITRPTSPGDHVYIRSPAEVEKNLWSRVREQVSWRRAMRLAQGDLDDVASTKSSSSSIYDAISTWGSRAFGTVKSWICGWTG
jgi:hypothetical protein